ncbi:MAG: hypothetical protein AVDCRST_MAG47-1402, partial [uncultured Nocardioidaceae bacterium]
EVDPALDVLGDARAAGRGPLPRRRHAALGHRRRRRGGHRHRSGTGRPVRARGRAHATPGRTRARLGRPGGVDRARVRHHRDVRPRRGLPRPVRRRLLPRREDRPGASRAHGAGDAL